MIAISMYCEGIYKALVFEGDKLVAVLTDPCLKVLEKRVKAAYGIKLI